MRKVQGQEFKAVEPWRVICAMQTEPDYNEERYMLLYAEDEPAIRGGHEFVLLEGYHCSCYDWNDVEWKAVVYTYEELRELSASKLTSGCYYDEEREFWRMVRRALGFSDVGLGGTAVG